MTHKMSRKQYVILTEYNGQAPECLGINCNNERFFEFSKFGKFCSAKCRANSPKHIKKSQITLAAVQEEMVEFKLSHDGMTKSEWKLWKRGNLQELGFTYQRIINLNEQDEFIRKVGNWVKVDFLHDKKLIVIEADGWSHERTEELDSERDEKLKNFGYKVLRFSNDQIKNDFDTVIEKIHKRLKI